MYCWQLGLRLRVLGGVLVCLSILIGRHSPASAQETLSAHAVVKVSERAASRQYEQAKRLSEQTTPAPVQPIFPRPDLHSTPSATAAPALRPVEPFLFPVQDPLGLLPGQASQPPPEPLIFPDTTPPPRSPRAPDSEPTFEQRLVGQLLDNMWLVAFLLALSLGLLLLVGHQIRRSREIKRRISMLEQSHRYPTLAWQPAADLKPFIPHRPNLTRLHPSYESEDTEAFLQAADDALNGETPADLDAQDEQDAQSRERDRPDKTQPQGAALLSFRRAGEMLPDRTLEGSNGRHQLRQAAVAFADIPSVFTAAERAVLEAMFNQEQVLDHELKDMLDQRGFRGVLLKGVVGDIVRKTGSEGRPWIRVHYASGSYSYQLQYLPEQSPAGSSRVYE